MDTRGWCRGFRRPAALLLVVAIAGCNSEIYLRDGVTDGDTFYLADRALGDADPALQSWVSYSLTLSTCQLKIGGENPARATSFACELTARRYLLESWVEHRRDDPTFSDPYLDTLARVDAAGYLPEYVAHYFARQSWQVPADLDADGFEQWRQRNLRRHEPETRLIGSWNYARNVNRLP